MKKLMGAAAALGLMTASANMSNESFGKFRKEIKNLNHKANKNKKKKRKQVEKSRRLNRKRK